MDRTAVIYLKLHAFICISVKRLRGLGISHRLSALDDMEKRHKRFDAQELLSQRTRTIDRRPSTAALFHTTRRPVSLPVAYLPNAEHLLHR